MATVPPISPRPSPRRVERRGSVSSQPFSKDHFMSAGSDLILETSDDVEMHVHKARRSPCPLPHPAPRANLWVKCLMSRRPLAGALFPTVARADAGVRVIFAALRAPVRPGPLFLCVSTAFLLLPSPRPRV